jgi:diketogulonate reductase-like aldo/keto reductase
MLTRTIPATKEPMPVIGLGTWQSFDIGTNPAARAERAEVLRVLFEGGGRVIDTSPMYGRAEEVTGDLLAQRGARQKAFLATKVWTRGREEGIAQMRHSARLLRTEVIDLMQIHNLVDWEMHLRILRGMKSEGSIRYLGITHYTTGALPDLVRILEREPVDFVQCGYSIAARAAEQRLLPLAAERGVAVIVNQPLGQGSLLRKLRGHPLPDWAREIDVTSWAQFLLKFIIAHPAVTCVIPATANPAHMEDNIAAGRGRMPDAKQRTAMAAVWDSL